MRVVADIPDVMGIADTKIRSVLQAVRTNMLSQGRVKGDINDSFLTVSDLAGIGMIGVDGLKLYSKVSASGASSGSGGTGSIRTASAVFSAESGLAVGSYYLSGINLPIRATISRAYYKVLSSFTGGAGATIGIGIDTDDAGGIVAPAGMGATWNAGWKATIQDGAVGNFSEETTEARKIQVDVGVDALTAGMLRLFVEYIVN